MIMRRTLLQVGRRSQRYASTTPTTSAEVPDDPDILTTQDPQDNPIDESPESHILSQHKSGGIDLSQKYPRLQYKPPPLGVIPAYDLALDMIKQHRAENVEKLQTTSDAITKLEQSSGADSTDELSSLKKHRRWLESLLDMHDPEIRWRAARGDVDLSMPVYRDLAERHWRSRQYHLIMERVTQMYVTPDILPEIEPTVDVRLTFPAREASFEVGQFVHSSESTLLPNIEVQSFADVGAKYTIAIIDPDVPDETNDSFKTYLHYLQTDVSLTPQDHAVESSNGTVVHDYVPPHPHKGTKYHRYTVVVWQQSSDTTGPSTASISREAFSARLFQTSNNLSPVGVSFWRQVWDDNVAAVMTKYPEVGFVEKNYKRIKA